MVIAWSIAASQLVRSWAPFWSSGISAICLRVPLWPPWMVENAWISDTFLPNRVSDPVS